MKKVTENRNEDNFNRSLLIESRLVVIIYHTTCFQRSVLSSTLPTEFRNKWYIILKPHKRAFVIRKKLVWSLYSKSCLPVYFHQEVIQPTSWVVYNKNGCSNWSDHEHTSYLSRISVLLFGVMRISIYQIFLSPSLRSAVGSVSVS